MKSTTKKTILFFSSILLLFTNLSYAEDSRGSSGTANAKGDSAAGEYCDPKKFSNAVFVGGKQTRTTCTTISNKDLEMDCGGDGQDPCPFQDQCPPQDVTWGNGNCSANVPRSATGSIRTVNSTNGRGQASFYCEASQVYRNNGGSSCRYCGNSVCESGENTFNCSSDCKSDPQGPLIKIPEVVIPTPSSPNPSGPQLGLITEYIDLGPISYGQVGVPGGGTNMAGDVVNGGVQGVSNTMYSPGFGNAMDTTVNTTATGLNAAGNALDAPVSQNTMEAIAAAGTNGIGAVNSPGMIQSAGDVANNQAVGAATGAALGTANNPGVSNALGSGVGSATGVANSPALINSIGSGAGAAGTVAGSAGSITATCGNKTCETPNESAQYCPSDCKVGGGSVDPAPIPVLIPTIKK